MPCVRVRNLVLGSGKPKICAPLTGKTPAELLDEIAAVRGSPADLAEWRVDHFAAVGDRAAVRETLPRLRAALGDVPLLFTCRSGEEGGAGGQSRDHSAALALEAAAAGADMVDVELFSGDDSVREVAAAARQRGVAVVVSSHDFHNTPPRGELLARLRGMRALGADIPKLAVMPASFADVLTLLAATNDFVAGGADCPVITMSMGGLGVLSRISGAFSGSCLSFAAVGAASAPGQLTARDLATILDILDVGL